MKLYLDDFTEGMQEMMDLCKQGSNIFEMSGGSLFPHNTSQKTWELARDDDKIHLTDGTHTYSFKGQLADYDSELERLPEVPLPDLFKHKNKHKAQVHRSDPGSIYFTLQEGRNNPTYTLKHMGDSKWKAIPKPKKVKDMLKQPLTPHNVNLEAVKEGMLKELENFTKEGFWNELDHGIGKVVQKGVNLPSNILTAFGRTGHVGEAGYLNPDHGASDSFGEMLRNAAAAGGVGAGAGGLYHLAKRNLLNTRAENEQEDIEGGHALKRIGGTGLAFAGLNALDRSMFPYAINNPGALPFSE